MNDITQHWRFQQVLIEAAQYVTLRRIWEADPKVARLPSFWRNASTVIVMMRQPCIK